MIARPHRTGGHSPRATVAAPTVGSKPVRIAWWHHWFLAPVLVLAISHAAIWATVTPPWQAPDEPTHYEFVRILADGLPLEPNPAIQANVMASLWVTDWWRFAALPLPARVPRTFVEEPFFSRDVQQVGRQKPLYYQLGAIVLGESGGSYDPLTDLLRLRAFSCLLFGVAVAIAYAAVWLLFRERRLAMTVATVYALLPMPAFIGASVNNDVLAMVAGTFGLVPAALLLRGRIVPGAITAALALIGSAIAKPTAFLAVAALLVAVVASLIWRALDSRRRLVVILGVVLIAGVGLLLVRDHDEVSAWEIRPAKPAGHVTTEARTGERALLLQSTPDTPSSAEQWTSIADLLSHRGRTVRVTVYVAGDNGATAEVLVQDGRNVSALTVPVRPDWQAVTLDHTLAPDAAILKVILTAHSAEGRQSVRFDDVAITAIDDPTGRTLIQNGGFEAIAATLRNNGIVRSLIGWDLGSYSFTYFIDPASWSAQRIGDFGYLIGRLHTTFWGDFGWATLPLPEPILLVISAVELLLVVAFVVTGVLRSDRPSVRFPGIAAIATGFLIVATIVRALPPDPFFAVGIAQGRYLFPALAMLLAGAIDVSVRLLPGRSARWAPVAWVLAVAVLAFVSLGHVTSRWIGA